MYDLPHILLKLYADVRGDFAVGIVGRIRRLPRFAEFLPAVSAFRTLEAGRAVRREVRGRFSSREVPAAFRAAALFIPQAGSDVDGGWNIPPAH